MKKRLLIIGVLVLFTLAMPLLANAETKGTCGKDL